MADTTRKIIRGVVNSRGFTITSAITQWDYGWQFIPEIEDLPATYRLDFSNEEKHGTALPVYCSTEGAEVPTELIDTGKDIWVWFVRIGDGYGITEYKWRIPNHCKPKTEEDEPTPSQQSSIDQLIVRSNEAVETAEEKAEEAGESAQSAKEDADRAERAKTDAETAQRKAKEAQESAERAKESAEQSANEARQKAESITGLTATAATLPEGSQATASYDAQTGVMSFGIPKGKDGTNGDDGYSPTANVTKSGKVATIAITDKNGTTTAQVSDGTDGTDGISPSVSVNEITGGHNVTVTDKSGSKTFDVMDGNTPNLTIGTVETLEPTESATATITGTPENPVLNLGIPQGEQGEVTLEEFYKAFPTDSASGSIASFPDGADDIPLKSLVVNIDPVQDLHGYDSPWVAGGGVNKFDEQIETGLYNTTGKVWGDSYWRCKNLIPVVSGQTYMVVKPSITFYWYGYADTSYTDGTSISVSNLLLTVPEGINFVAFAIKKSDYGDSYQNNIALNYPSTVTTYSPYENICPISGWTGCEVNATGYNIWDEEWESGTVSRGNPVSDSSRIRSKNYILCKPNTTYYFNKGVDNGNMWAYFYDRNKVCLNPTINGDNIGNKIVTTPDNCHYMKFFLSAQTEYQHDVTINYPSTDHDYHPYTGRSITINLGQTVYGGKLDVLTGILTVYPEYDSYNGETLTGEWISDRDVYAVGTTPTIGAQVVNIGAQGTEYQLEAHEVVSLLGQNNIWADTGDCSVEYRANTKLYIEKLTQPEEEDMIADSAITSGQFFMIGNALYRALTSIASGATITVGTNAQRVSLSDALNLVNA